MTGPAWIAGHPYDGGNTIRRIALMAALGAAFFVSGAAQASSRPASCSTVREHNRYVTYVLRTSVGGHGGDFHGATPTRRQLAKLGTMRSCMKQHDRARYRLERGAWEKHAAKNRLYRHLDAITACGEWVVCGVVEHESATSGYYKAYNPPATGCSGHGCIGAYQIDAQWFSRSCSQWAAIMWTPAGQHECAYVILQAQGMGAWGM